MVKSIFIIFLIFISVSFATAQSRLTFELFGGDVYNLPLPLIIRQQGYPSVHLTARYNTEAFTPPIYWDWRFCIWKKNKSWEFEAIHDKLYLQNTTPEVQKFNISHGFNMLFLNRGFDQKDFQYRVGVGLVLSHPESNIRGKEFGNSADDLDMGYYITGPILNLAIGKTYRLGNRFCLAAEARTTFAYSSVPLELGHTDIYNLAFHLVLGFGVDLIKPREE